MKNKTIDRGAVFCESTLYRYLLTRRWGMGRKYVTFIMLNPSTADAVKDDPTIRRCMSFAESWGFDALEIVNLFAFRATDPKHLKTAIDPVGPRNDFYILESINKASKVIVAWGNHGKLHDRAAMLKQTIYMGFHIDLVCLGQTKACEPRHPLYVRGETPTFIFQAAR